MCLSYSILVPRRFKMFLSLSVLSFMSAKFVEDCFAVSLTLSFTRGNTVSLNSLLSTMKTCLPNYNKLNHCSKQPYLLPTMQRVVRVNPCEPFSPPHCLVSIRV
uniref:Uncharacterized protein n=1 Tax=Cacopsylla melanoneura TaxID=428564 RepID=A0A8D9ECV9_9HEMI